MGSLKTAGPDRILPLFYQKFWGVLGESIINFVCMAFSTGEFQRDLNHSQISLMPKVENP